MEFGREELSCKWKDDRLHVYFFTTNNSEQKYQTVWTGSEYDAGAYGSTLVKRIVGREFPFPKSIYAVEDCLKSVIKSKQNAIVLDFFAGSGTTGHAILRLNKEDSGKRQFILCTNNEDNNESGVRIAADICYPRIKNVIQGYADKLNKENIKGLGGNLKYYSTAFVNNVKTDNDKRILTSRSTEMLCLAESTFVELTKNDSFAIYENATQITGIIYDEDAIMDFKAEVKRYKKPLVLYVFSYDHSYNKEEFDDIANLRAIKPIPEVLLNVYRKNIKELQRPRNS